MLHVMIDIETLGTRPWSVIRSIGAVSFDPSNGAVGHEFYVNVDRTSCENFGLSTEKRVEDWWKRQPAEARAAMEVDPRPLEEALDSLTRWFHGTGAKTVWSQGAAFDFPILETAYKFVGANAPWSFRKVRDTRTAYAVCGFDYDNMKDEREGTYHNALDDCRHQVKALIAALNGR